MKKVLQYTLPLLFAGGLLWYAYKDTDLVTLGKSLEGANYFWILVSLIPMTLGHLSRAQRWRMLLKPLGHSPSLYNTFMAVMAGYFANLVIPRLGEVTRCSVLYKTDKIPVNHSVGTVLVERGFDLLSLGIATGLALLLEYQKLSNFFMSKIGQKRMAGTSHHENGFGIWIVLSVVTLVAILFWLNRKKIINLPITQKIIGFASGLLNGILSVTKIEGKGWFLFHSLFIWLTYFAVNWLAMLALPETAPLGAKAALLLFVVGSFGMVAPVQGGIGAYHYMVIAGLTELYALSELAAQSFAFLSHSVTTLYVIIVGGIGFVLTVGKTVNTEKNTSI